MECNWFMSTTSNAINLTNRNRYATLDWQLYYLFRKLEHVLYYMTLFTWKILSIFSIMSCWQITLLLTCFPAPQRKTFGLHIVGIQILLFFNASPNSAGDRSVFMEKRGRRILNFAAKFLFNPFWLSVRRFRPP